jgi:hypothetical protein
MTLKTDNNDSSIRGDRTMSAGFKIRIANKKILCTPNGGNGRFPHKTALTWEGDGDDPFTLEFFADGTNKQTPKWPFQGAAPIPPSSITTPFTRTLAEITDSEVRFAYGISKGGVTLDPIIIVVR